MGVHIEIETIDELGHEITWAKGGPGLRSGGTPPDQSGGHPEPGGECFAPFSCSTKNFLYDSLFFMVRPYAVAASRMPNQR